jgi:hypothetical protein
LAAFIRRAVKMGVSVKNLVGIAALLLTTAMALDANAAQTARPIHLSLRHGAQHSMPGTAQLPQWNGSFTDRTGKLVNFTMAGGNPADTATTHIPVVLVPVIAVYGQDNGNRVFDPTKHKVSNGQTVVQNVVNSPLFTSDIDYIQGGTDLGTTQFIDAFQRGNFWSSVKKNPGYHLVYDVSVGEPLEIQVNSGQGNVMQNPVGGGKIGTFGFADFDSQAEGYISVEQATINPGVIPLFVSYNVFLTEGGCCIGGYHYAEGGAPGGQTYAFATYVDAKKSFAEDVSVIAVELGELTDDPFSSNLVNCTDSPSLSAGATVGLKHVYPYTQNNFTYRLPSLDFVTYFGAPKSTSVNKWYSFQGEQKHVCAGQ